MINKEKYSKISAQLHTAVKQICFPSGNVFFLSLFSLSKNWMHNVVWGCAEILPILWTVKTTYGNCFFYFSFLIFSSVQKEINAKIEDSHQQCTFEEFISACSRIVSQTKEQINELEDHLVKYGYTKSMGKSFKIEATSLNFPTSYR